MRRTAAVLCSIVLSGLSAPPAAAAGAEKTYVLVGAGDIARCSNPGREATAKLLDTIPGTVYTLGDNVYPTGSAAQWKQCYDPTWGRAKARTRPVIGNHDYDTAKGKPYFDYFGSAAGPRDRGYYSYDLGAWHIVVLNSNCKIVACGADSTQARWLRDDLARTRSRCTVSMWHHPLYTSGRDHGPEQAVRPLFQILYDSGVELNLSGHNHNYERFAPLDANGRTSSRGVLPIVVGTGGANHYGFAKTQAHSLVRNGDTFGVLKLTLHDTWLAYAFVPEAGKKFTDSGTVRCR